jgi:hypothetical protein
VHELSPSLKSGLGASDRGGVACGVESECKGESRPWFLSHDMLGSVRATLVGRFPGMVGRKEYLPFWGAISEICSNLCIRS